MKNIVPDNYIEVYDSETIQGLLYKIVYQLHDICVEHNITYSLAYGSMIGAVRHNAIIPWDDDVDIVIARPDYEKLINIFTQNGGCIHDLKIHEFRFNSKYPYPFAKIGLKGTILFERTDYVYNDMQLYVDVFPYDVVPIKNKDKRYHRAEVLFKKRVVGTIKLKPSKTWWKKPFIIYRYFEKFFLKRFVGIENIVRKEIIEATSDEYDSNNMITYRSIYSKYVNAYEISKADFYDCILMKFGTKELYVHRSYDSLLKKLYGDYMTPPPLDKRVSNHNFKLYVLKKYLK